MIKINFKSDIIIGIILIILGIIGIYVSFRYDAKNPIGILLNCGSGLIIGSGTSAIVLKLLQ
jgi:hypothetical protein